MNTRDIADRRFLVWVKCGNINHLVYDNDLICEPEPADPLVPIYSAEFLDHAKNVTSWQDPLDDRVFNTEDNLAIYSELLLDKGKLYEQFNVVIEGKNSVTGAAFTLQAYSFSFAGVQISNDGRYLLNESLTINPTLPSTSSKIDALFLLAPALDTPTQYGVSIHAPILLDWRYWIALANVSVDFWPNQNKNWQQYDSTGDWSVQVRLQLVADGLANNYEADLTILDYDSNPNVISDIQLFIDSTNQNVGIVTEGQLMRVVATHELVSGTWNNDAWGTITAEPVESGPRKIISTAIPYDNDPANPLIPLTGAQMTITYPAPNIARMECYFNPDLINTNNGIKFTSKIKKRCDPKIDPRVKVTTDGLIKSTTNDIDKIIS
jgi:hypothetical protein